MYPDMEIKSILGRLHVVVKARAMGCLDSVQQGYAVFASLSENSKNIARFSKGDNASHLDPDPHTSIACPANRVLRGRTDCPITSA